MSKSTAHRIVHRVSEALASLNEQIIHFPDGPDIVKTQTEFFKISSFPRVIGAVDCTHVKIISPGNLHFHLLT